MVYKEATDLLQEYYNCFVDETRLAGKGPAMIETEAGVAALEKDMLQKKIARPLSECRLLCLAIPHTAHPPFMASSLVSNHPCVYQVAIPVRGHGLRCVDLDGQQAMRMSPSCSPVLQASCRHRCRGRLCCGRGVSS